MCLWQPILWRKLFTCRLPNPCLSPLSQLSSSSERPRVHCDHTRVHNTRPTPPSTIMPAAKNASKKKNDKEGLAVKKTVKTKAAPKPKKEKKPKAPKPKAAPKKKVIFLSLFYSNPFSWPGCSGITWISSHFYHQFQFIVVTLCLKAMNKRFVLVYCSSFKNMYVAMRVAPGLS